MIVALSDPLRRFLRIIFRVNLILMVAKIASHLVSARSTSKVSDCSQRVLFVLPHCGETTNQCFNARVRLRCIRTRHARMHDGAGTAC